MKTPSKWKYTMRRWTLKSEPRVYVTGQDGGEFKLYTPDGMIPFGSNKAIAMDAGELWDAQNRQA